MLFCPCRQKWKLFCCVLFIQIVTVVWIASRSKVAYTDSVLGRLRNDAEGRPLDGILHMKEDSSVELYTWYGKDVCISEGHNPTSSREASCECREGWAGKRCGIPKKLLDVDWMKDPNLVAGLQVRKRPRRIIYVINDFFYDFCILEWNLKYVGDLIDVFIVSEDQKSYFYKSGSLLNRFQENYLSDFHNRLVYVNLSEANALTATERMHYTVNRGLGMMSDIRPDDILLLASPSNIFSRKVLTFMKVFHNYPLPISCSMEEYMYGFSYQKPPSTQMLFRKLQSAVGIGNIQAVASQQKTTTKIPPLNNEDLYEKYAHNNLTTEKTCALSVHMFYVLYEGKISRLVDESLFHKKKNLDLFNELQQPMFPWSFPHAGYNCRMCSTNRQILYKLQRLPEADQPKWLAEGDLDRNLAHIDHLKKRGLDEYLKKYEKTNNEDNLNDICDKGYEEDNILNFLHTNL